MPGKTNGFGAWVTKWRRAKSLSVKQAADAVGITRGYLWGIERSKFGIPSERVLRALGVTLDIPEDEVLARAGRLPADVIEALKARPDLVGLVRVARGLSPDAIRTLGADVARHGLDTPG